MGQIIELALRPDVTVVAVLVPAGNYDWDIVNIDGKNYLNGDDDDGMMQMGREPLPPGQYEIVGLLRDFQEEQAAELMEYVDDVAGYLDYSESYNLAFDSAIDSFKTLIDAQGGDPEQNWLLLKKIQ